MKKKLYRIKENAYISGVCSGLAEYTDIDVTIIRLLWVVFSLFFTAGFGGVILYIVCIFIIPVAPDYIDGEYKETEI